MFQFMCDINPTDQLKVYTTDMERPPVEHIALVMENELNEKISVLLTRDVAILLQNQLNDFIINGHR